MGLIGFVSHVKEIFFVTQACITRDKFLICKSF